MPDQVLGDLIKDLSLDDVRVDQFGRVVITSPSIADKLKGAATLRPDERARDDVNIICCGNSTCGRRGELDTDLGMLVERFTRGGVR